MSEKVIPYWTLLTTTLFVLVSISDCATEDPLAPKSIKGPPIVIRTVAQHYNNPTLGEYHLCTKSRDDCISRCGSFDSACRATCPTCPILVDQDVLVQGINDTLYRSPISSGDRNQTTIIRLTNEIRNIIESTLGNITANSQTNVNVYHNKTSKTGGRFGLGFDERGPCCFVIEAQKCRQSANDANCLPRRKRSCGSHCISRHMRAKRIVTCSDTDPNACSQGVEYIPQLRRPGCKYTSKWPFISCKAATQHSSTSTRRTTKCSDCYNLPYINVMRGQVPKSCLPCYGQQRRQPSLPRFYQPAPTYYGGYGSGGYGGYPFHQPYYPAPAPSYNHMFGNNWSVEPEYDDNDDFVLPEGDWKVEDRKCLNQDGSIAENCSTDTGIENSPNEDNDNDNDDDNIDEEGADYDYSEDDVDQTQSRRRHRRHKNNYYRN